MLLTLWQAAAEDGLVAEPPRRKVMQIRVPEKLHRAWSADQVRLLLIAADRLRGYYSNGISRRWYWRSYVLTAWDTGLRGCDLRRMTADAVRNAHTSDDQLTTLSIVQHKTGRLKRLHLRAETVAAINETFPPERELLWPMWCRLEGWRRAARKLVAAAGLSGTIGQMRHSSGTAVELLHPGRGHEHLGNTRQVFERHYLDHQKVCSLRVQPPSLL